MSLCRWPNAFKTDYFNFAAMEGPCREKEDWLFMSNYYDRFARAFNQSGILTDLEVS
jgi:hypothetical protein